MTWTEDGILYTDRPRRATRVTPRPAHRAAPRGVDWWLGKTVVRGPQEWFVVAAEPHGAVMMLVLESEDGHIEKVSLVVANHALRTGDWSLL